MLKNRFSLRNVAKILVASLAVVAMFTSCKMFTKVGDDKGKDTSSQLSKEDKILAELWDNAEQYAGGVPIQAQPADDRAAALAKNEITFIGYGINLFNGPTIGDALKAPLLAKEIYTDVSNGGGNSYIWSEPMTSLVSTSSISEKFNEVYSGLNISAGLGTGKGVPFFSGSVQAEYGSSSKVESEAKFYKYLYSATTKKQTIGAAYKDEELLSGLIDTNCIKLINGTKSPEQLFNALGTHIVLEGFTGGSASITGIYNSSTAAGITDISAALKFESYWVNGNAKTTLTDKQQAIAKKTSISVNAMGGTTTELIGATIPTIGEKIEKWAKTVDNGPTLATITGAMPIWELATNTARKNELKNYFYEHADQISQALLGYFTKDAAPETQKTVVDGGVYYIRSKASGWSIVVQGNSKVNQASIALSSPNNIDQQKWVAVEYPKGSDRFGFKSYYTGHYINISQGSVHERLMQFVHNGVLQPNELWRIEENPDGTVFIHSQMNDEFKIYAPNPTRNDVALGVVPAYTDNVKWKFVKVQ